MKMNKKIVSNILLSLSTLLFSTAWAGTPGTVTISTAPSTIEPSYKGDTASYVYQVADNTNANINATDLQNYERAAKVWIQGGNNTVAINTSLILDGNSSGLVIGEKNNPVNVVVGNNGQITLASTAGVVPEFIIFAKTITRDANYWPWIHVNDAKDTVRIYQHPINFKNFLPIQADLTNARGNDHNFINAITVYTARDLQEMRVNTDANYMIMQNINMSGWQFKPIEKFTGTLMADPILNYTPVISNLNVIESPAIGDTPLTPAFIGRLTGTIENITFSKSNAMVVREMDGVTPLNDYRPLRPLIKHVLVEHANINIPEFSGDVDAFNQYGVGALVGTMNDGHIINSGVTDTKITGDIAPAGVGGLVGYVTKGNISHAGANVTINVTSGLNENTNVGGLIGLVNGNGRVSIQYSASAGSITGDAANLGGLIGTANIKDYYPGSPYYSIVQDSDSRASVTVANYPSVPTYGDRYVGGFIGSSNTPIVRAYSVGQVTVPANAASNSLHVGGFAGALNAKVDLSHWDMDTSGYTQAAGTANTTALPEGDSDKAMSQIATFAGWDIQQHTLSGKNTPSVWFIALDKVHYPYPHLTQFPFASAFWNQNHS
jgi:hypothetical protein